MDPRDQELTPCSRTQHPTRCQNRHWKGVSVCRCLRNQFAIIEETRAYYSLRLRRFDRREWNENKKDDDRSPLKRTRSKREEKDDVRSFLRRCDSCNMYGTPDRSEDAKICIFWRRYKVLMQRVCVLQQKILEIFNQSVTKIFKRNS